MSTIFTDCVTEVSKQNVFNYCWCRAVTKHLIAIAQEQGHQVSVIEKQEERARYIMQEFDVRVFHAYIAKGKILEETDVKNADTIIATTKDDAFNLMAMMLGKHYQVKNLALVN